MRSDRASNEVERVTGVRGSEAPEMGTELERKRTSLTSLSSRRVRAAHEPFNLSSGGTSHDYVDGKRAVATTDRLRLLGK